MTARALRFPLLLCLVVLYLTLAPGSEVAAQINFSCPNGPGNYYGCSPINGWTSPNCGTPTYCRIGNNCFTWECYTNEGGEVVVRNVQSAGQTFCYCGPGYMKCC